MLTMVDGKKIIEYLTVLGLSTKDVLTIDELKRNYRKLAKYYHPDNHETGDAEQFKKVQEAYDYCQDNLEYVNKQIKADFTISDSGFSSKEEEAFATMCVRVMASMHIFGFEVNEQLTRSKLDENYLKLKILFQTILRDQKRLNILNDAYSFLNENFDLVNLLVICQFNYSIFKAAQSEAEEMKREKERKEAETRAAREKAERERMAREAEERRKAAEERKRVEEERKKREAAEKARREAEAKEAKVFYKNRIEEEIEKIVLSNYSQKNQAKVKTVFSIYRNKEIGITRQSDIPPLISHFKTSVGKIKNKYQQRELRKKICFAGIIASGVAVVVAISFGIKGIADESNRKKTYENNVFLMKTGDYYNAKAGFEAMNGYKESESKIKVCDGLIQLSNSTKTKSQNDAINGIKTIISGGEPVHVFYDSSSGHSIKKNKLNPDSSQHGEIISSLNFTLYNPPGDLNNGYSFSHWYSDSVTYDDMTILCLDSSWDLNTYSIYYHLDGGKNSESNPTGYTIETNSISLGAASKENYTFSGWFDKESGGNRINTIEKGSSGDIHLYAKYEINHYTVNFYNWDSTKLYSTQVDHGGDVEYPYGIPEKNPDQQYTYTFSGWDKSLKNITQNTDLIAQYSNSLNQYTVVFKNYDGTILGTDTVDYGSPAEYKGEEPLKPNSEDDRIAYTFSHWDISLDDIRDNCVAVAQFEETNRYLARFLYGDELLYSIMMNEGEVPSYKGNIPLKEATQQYSFEFDKWNPVPSAIHEDTDYQPDFSSTLNKYTVTFKNYDGEVLGTTTVDYGSAATYTGPTPTKPTVQEHSYKFVGWDISLENIVEDIDAIAVFEEYVTQCTVTFKNYDGTVLGTDTVDYGGTAQYNGATPTKPKTQQYNYTFSGWNISLTNVTYNKVATALYSSGLNEYTVTFVNYDDSVLYSCVVPYGSGADYIGDIPEKPNSLGCYYTFSKWDKKYDNITGDTTIKAQFTAELINGVFNLSFDGKSYILEQISETVEELFIPSTHNGLPVTNMYRYNAIGVEACVIFDDNLRKITFEEGFKSIGQSALAGLTKLTSVYLPDSLTSIGKSAFSRCTSLKKIFIPYKVTSIGDYAFGGLSDDFTIYCERYSAYSEWGTWWNRQSDYTYTSSIYRYTVIYKASRSGFEAL